MAEEKRQVSRLLQGALEEALTDTPVVCLLGARQSGKTTLAKILVPDRDYITLAFLSLLLSVLTGGGSSLFAGDLRLASALSDHMVLQRDKPVAVWGWADPGESVTVSFADQSKAATASADGQWSLKLDALAASAEPRVLLVSGKEGRKVEVKDVLVGEVWLGSGQSNMAMTVAGCYHFDAEKAAAKDPLIRHYRESSGPSDAPQAEGKGSWQLCTPDNVGGFSATLYFFGREIRREVGVPVGLINTSVGGTPIESWVAAEVQSSDPGTKANYETRLDTFLKFDPAQAHALHQKQIAIWKAAFEKAKAKGTPFVVPAPKDPLAMHKLKGGPAGLYNGKVVNLVPYTLRGMLWYQGEGNAKSNPDLYHKQLTQLVTSWRALWQDEVPFAWVQLPNYTSPGEGWPRVREAMLKTLTLPKTGMAITIDLGDAKDIHPKNKQDVGKRLSYWALGTVYGKNVSATSGPLPAGSTIDGNAITVSFQHTNGGLKSITGGPLTGFQIADADQQWKPAEAKIVGETVVISSAEVAQPVAVRYAWKDWPDYSFANGAGLPASPFRTDDWPAVKK
ncbi:MAG: sialate O-acetylesterase [Verrucomicrobiales bacterium]|nr:sialate O-acetylesterase [Verrucomicrobiales bacterium]